MLKDRDEMRAIRKSRLEAGVGDRCSCSEQFFAYVSFFVSRKTRGEICIYLRNRRLSVAASKKDNQLAQTAEILNFLLFLDEKRNDHPILPPSSLPLEIQRIVDDINDNFTEIRSVTDILERHYISAESSLNKISDISSQ